MNKYTLPVLILLALVFLTSCGGNATQTTPTPVSPTETAIQPTPPPAPTETAIPTVAATETTVATEAPATEASVTGQISFASNVMPIFEAKCIKCHGVESKKEGLDMRTYDVTLAGSFNGPVLTPGNADNSLLVQLIERGKMPNRGQKLTPEEIQIIRDWVNQGALNN